MTVTTVLHVRCLGTFALRSDGDWCTREAVKRGRVLLQYLVNYPNAHVSCETLAEALWPEHDADNMAHRLHLAVSGARATLRRLMPGDDAIVRMASAYAWHDAIEIQSDVDQLLRASRDGTPAEMENAADHYSGEFLSGETAEWTYPLRLRCSSAYAHILEQLATAALKQHDCRRALEWSLRLSECDRSHEGAARLVMRALAGLGRRGAALMQYDELARYLRRHLAMEPSPQTQAVRDEIRRGTLVLA